MNKIIFKSPIGNMFITETNNELIEIGVLKGNEKMDSTYKTSSLLEEARTQMMQYFNGTRKAFNLPLKFVGTDFQKRIWNELLRIPYGKTISYKQLAERVNSPNAVRAVGNANNKNNFLIVVPCHRVIGSNGKLVGYAEGLDVKKFLLDFENENI